MTHCPKRLALTSSAFCGTSGKSSMHLGYLFRSKVHHGDANSIVLFQHEVTP